MIDQKRNCQRSKDNLFRLELIDGGDGSKDLLLWHRHVVAQVGQDGRLVVQVAEVVLSSTWQWKLY